jgi:hypothetical protein
MGTWDIGYFDNDIAADFAGGLDDAAPQERAGLLRVALERAARNPGTWTTARAWRRGIRALRDVLEPVPPALDVPLFEL